VAAVEEYLSRLGKAFEHVTPAEREDIVAEVRSHVIERIEGEPGADDNVVDDVLRAVGDPAELARQHRTEAMLRRAEKSRSPWVLLRSTLRWATTGGAGMVAVFVTLLGYGCAAVCYLSALLKPLFPARIGLWLQPGHTLTLGYWDGRWSASEVYGISVRPPSAFVLGTLGPTEGPIRELLGPWLLPVGLLSGALLAVATTLVVRGFIRAFGPRKWSGRPRLPLAAARLGSAARQLAVHDPPP
jgi:hypothetical protein